MALGLSWTGYADTDLQFAEFFGASHTLSVRFMLQCPRGYEGPFIAENGTGTFFLGQGSYTKAASSPHLLLAVGSASLVTPIVLVAGYWYHLAMTAKVTASERVFRLYLNGIPISDQLEMPAKARGMPVGTLRFGKRTSGKTVNDRNAQCYGLLAEIAIFNKVVSEATILALAANTAHLSGTEAGLLAGYTFADGVRAKKLSRPVSLHGAATQVAISSNWNHTQDAKRIPLPSHQQPMDLPFPPGEAWLSDQAWNGDGSHTGLAGFCWDFYIDGPGGEYPEGSDGAPFYAAAPGTVTKVVKTASSGINAAKDKNYIDILQTPGEYASYIHLRKNSPEVAARQRVKQGAKLALTGDTGTPVGVFHLHFAVNDKPDGAAGFVTIPVAFSDYEARAADGTWKHVARGVPGTEQVVRNPPTPDFGPRSLAPESAIARAANRLDLVATDKGGRIWIARWESGRYARNWDRWRQVLNDIGGARAAGVASRDQHLLDVVATDAAGRVYTGAWSEHWNHGVWGGWWRIRNLVGKSDSPVTIVARDSTKLDVFAVRSDGAICTAAWDANAADGKWRGWWPIGSGKTHAGSPITAVARSPHQLDVFVTGLDGGIYTAAWDGKADGKWHGWWRIGTLAAVPGTRVTAVARDANKLDIFAVRKGTGLYGGVWTAAWDRNVENGKWRGWWRIGAETALLGAPVGVVARDADKLDVFVVGKNGGVYSAAYDRKAAQGQWRGWWRIRDLVAHPGSAVAAVARDSKKLDIFAVRKDGQMSTAAWDAQVDGGDWRGWWRIG